ncbi:hypothetical protein AMTR_s00122p00101360 [Amborella trichopoda]|uniref:Uncharacterized protein n=1 Tax=Amborella trichopoda TaxID=13333 RepID=W1NN69_AMBTC|nr:hypothetical protein AMTR_s00122p00101360 [Amborella trichopoda]
MGMNIVRGVLHLLDDGSVASLRDVEEEILPVLEFVGTMRVDTEKLCDLVEQIIQDGEKVSLARDVAARTFPSIIAEKERVIIEHKEALLADFQDHEAAKDKVTKFRADHTWLEEWKRIVLDEMSELESRFSAKKRQYRRLLACNYFLDENIAWESYDLDQVSHDDWILPKNLTRTVKDKSSVGGHLETGGGIGSKD